MKFASVAHISCLLAIVLMTGCKVTDSYKQPETKMPEIKIPDGRDAGLPKDFFVCDKVFDNISEELKRDALSIQGYSELQDIEKTDCDGNKTLVSKWPLLNFRYNLTLDPPENLRAQVTYADIENARTCSERRVTVKPGARVPEMQSLEWLTHPYWVDETGQMQIGLSNSSFRFLMGLNVLNGQNLITVIYYGRCLKKSDKNGTCLKGEEIGRKKFLVSAAIENREINGISAINTCTTKKK